MPDRVAQEWGTAFAELSEVLRPFGMAQARAVVPYSRVPIDGPVWAEVEVRPILSTPLPLGTPDAECRLAFLRRAEEAIAAVVAAGWVHQRAPRVELGGQIVDRYYTYGGDLADPGHTVHECVVHLEVARAARAS